MNPQVKAACCILEQYTRPPPSWPMSQTGPYYPKRREIGRLNTGTAHRQRRVTHGQRVLSLAHSSKARVRTSDDLQERLASKILDFATTRGGARREAAIR